MSSTFGILSILIQVDLDAFLVGLLGGLFFLCDACLEVLGLSLCLIHVIVEDLGVVVLEPILSLARLKWALSSRIDHVIVVLGGVSPLADPRFCEARVDFSVIPGFGLVVECVLAHLFGPSILPAAAHI